MTEVHRSDLFRWRLLHTIGGFWSDIDIVYFRPMSYLNLDMTADALLCWGEIEELKTWQAIGFLAGKPGANLFKNMEEIGKVLIKTPHLRYQDLGTDLLTRFALPGELESVGSRIAQIPQHSVYPFDLLRDQMASLWQNYQLIDSRKYTVGVHWFAAQQLSCEKEAAWSGFDDVLKDDRMGAVKWAMFQAGLIKEVKNTKKEQNKFKYSIILPYYRRAKQLNSTLASFVKLYKYRKDYEIIIANDIKSATIDTEERQLREIIDKYSDKLTINLILTGNADVWNPVLAFQEASRQAQGEYLVITNPECLHRADVLKGLDEEFAKKPDVYVICACLHIDQEELLPDQPLPIGKWYQHSRHRNIECHFCSALSKETYQEVGGFDVEYAKGMGFDDDDFRNRLKRANVHFVLRDDLLTVHLMHPNNKPNNYRELHDINKRYYEKIWGNTAPRAEGHPLSMAARV
jgi:GT2 family glycosyltransferase